MNTICNSEVTAETSPTMLSLCSAASGWQGGRHISPRGFTDLNDLEFWERKWLVLCQVNSQLQETARDTHLFTVPSSVRVQTISVGPHWLYLQSILYSMVESFPQGQCLSQPDSINVLATVSYIFPSILADCLLSHITTYTFLLHSVNTFFFLLALIISNLYSFKFNFLEEYIKHILCWNSHKVALCHKKFVVRERKNAKNAKEEKRRGNTKLNWCYSVWWDKVAKRNEIIVMAEWIKKENENRCKIISMRDDIFTSEQQSFNWMKSLPLAAVGLTGSYWYSPFFECGSVFVLHMQRD